MNVKSVEISAPGVLHISNRQPDFESDRMLNLECSAISPLDQQISQGYFPLANQWPLVPGTSGVAVDSAGLRYFVFAEGIGGGIQRPGVHQELFSFPDDVIFPIPSGIVSETVAISMISFLSIFSIFDQLENVPDIRKILILGANGSIGEVALLIAEFLGFEATGVTREGNRVLDRSTLTYDDLKPKYAGSGFNVVIDPLGGVFTKLASRFVEPSSQHFVIGLSGGNQIEIDGGDLLGKGYALRGFNLLQIPLSKISLHVEKTFEFLRGGGYVPAYERKLNISSGIEAYGLAYNSRKRVLLTR